MQQDVDPTTPAAPAAPDAAVETPVASSATPAYDPAYVSQLEVAYNEAQSRLLRYAPIAEEIEWVAADPSRANGLKRYRKAYEESAQPAIDPVFQPVVEAFRAEIAPMRAYITRAEEAERRQQAEQRQNFERENIAFAARLQAEHKLSPEQLNQVAAYADAKAGRLRRNVGIEEAYKDMTSFAAPREKSPPPSLRADAGAVGVPGPSTNNTDRWKADFHGALVDSLKAAQKAV
jgi:hypothetical protein